MGNGTWKLSMTLRTFEMIVMITENLKSESPYTVYLCFPIDDGHVFTLSL